VNRRGPSGALGTLLLVVAVGVIVGFTLYRTHARGDKVRSETNAPVASEATSAAANEATVDVPVFRAPATPSTSSPRAKPDAARARLQARVDHTHALLASRFAAETVDRAWAAGTETTLTTLATSDQIRAMDAGIEHLDVDCRATMCRIGGDFDTITQGDDWFTLYMANVAANVPSASYKYDKNPDGTWHMTVYAIGRK